MLVFCVTGQEPVGGRQEVVKLLLCTDTKVSCYLLNREGPNTLKATDSHLFKWWNRLVQVSVLDNFAN